MHHPLQKYPQGSMYLQPQIFRAGNVVTFVSFVIEKFLHSLEKRKRPG